MGRLIRVLYVVFCFLPIWFPKNTDQVLGVNSGKGIPHRGNGTGLAAPTLRSVIALSDAAAWDGGKVPNLHSPVWQLLATDG